MNSRSSAGRLPKVSVKAGEGMAAAAGADLVLDLMIFTLGLLGFVVATRLAVEEELLLVPMLLLLVERGVFVGRFFSVVTFLGKPLPLGVSDWLRPLARHSRALKVPW